MSLEIGCKPSIAFSDGQVRVRGLASDEQNRTLMNSPGLSDTSRSSFGQISGQVMSKYWFFVPFELKFK